MGTRSAVLLAAGLWVLAAVIVPEPSARTAAYSDCEPALAHTPGDSLIVLQRTHRLVQPLAEPGNVAACSLGVRWPSYAWPTLDVVAWDADSLMPDPTTIALRTRRFDPSSYQFAKLATVFSPPVVTRALSGLADGRATAPALLLRHEGFASNGLYLQHDPDADPQQPAARIAPVDGAFQPLPGAHPVLAQDLCEGSLANRELRVVQAVMTTDVLLPASTDDLAQRFRVPGPVTLSWFEIANGVDPAVAPSGPVEVSVHADDETGDLGPALARGFTSEYIAPAQGPRWIPTLDLDAEVTLLPGVDYWLVVRSAQQWTMYTRQVHGTETPEFTSAIGPLRRRPAGGGAWSPLPASALCFRLIGRASTVIGVEPPRVPATLRLSARPNPTQGDLWLGWSGASGWVRVQVVDLGGRVVGELERDRAAVGERRWDGRLRDGRRLPGGVYLLRATDSAGATAVRRVVLLR